MINIVLATDDNYVQHCSVVIASVIKNNDAVNFYILTEGISSYNKELLLRQVEKNGSTITFCVVDSNLVNHLPMPKAGGDHISLATYYRLFIDKLLPDTIDTVLYLDCDIVVRGSLVPLFNILMDDYALGAVYQSIRGRNNEDDFERLGIPREEGYFNAGVLLINLKYWRDYNVPQRLFAYIREHSSCIKQHDQDVLNAVLYKETMPISNIWNYLPIFYLKHPQVFPRKVNYICHLQNPTIVHYVSVPKPWEFGAKHPFKSDYYKYLDLTPFRGWRPPFVFSKYREHILRPALIKFFLFLDVFKLRQKIRWLLLHLKTTIS